MTENQETPFWKKIILGICIAEAVAIQFFPLFFLAREADYVDTNFCYWFVLLPMIGGVVFSFSYLKATKGFVRLRHCLEMAVKPAIPFAVAAPLLLLFGCISRDFHILFRGVVTYGFAFLALGVPVFFEIFLVFYFCFRTAKPKEEILKIEFPIETTPDVMEPKAPFKVNKMGIIICMIVTMLMGSWPYFWYAKEKAINEAYGYENMDSFNFIGERLASSYMSLMLAIPLALVYLRCLRGIKTREMAFLAALVPFMPWIVVDGFSCLLTFGFLFLVQLAIIVPLLLHVVMTAVCVCHCCCMERKQGKYPIVVWIGYSFTLIVAALGIFLMAF